MNAIPVEREIKVLEINYKLLESKLKKLGANKTFKGWIHDLYFDYPEKILYYSGIRVRLRNKNNEKIVFSFKDKGVDFKAMKKILKNRSFLQKIKDVVSLKDLIKARTIANIRKRLSKFALSIQGEKEEELKIKEAKEIEFEVPGEESMTYIMNVFGLQPIAEKKKHRVTYELLTYQGKVVFDFDKYDGIPWLVEIEGPSADVIYKRVEKLGLQDYPIKTFGSRGLFAYYKKPYLELV